MQKLAEICIRRPVFAVMLVLALVVVGAASWFRLGVDRFPAIDLPTVTVRTSLPGASPEEVETVLSQPVEEAVNTVAGVQELRSVSGQGNSFVIATFDLDRDIEVAAQDVRDRVAGVVRDLPPDVQPPVVAKADNDSAPVLTIAVTADRPLRELTEIADKLVKVQLERSTGVGEVEVVGGLERSINVWVEADRLAAYKLPITAVRDAIHSQNADAPGGNVTGAQREQVLRTLGRITDPRGFDDLVIATVGGSPIRVRDIGHAEDGTKEQRSLARLNGVPTVTVEVRRQSGANTVEVIESVKQNLARVAAQLPPDVKLEVIRDQSRYIYGALHEINSHLVLGALLASLVVFLFMRSWRTTVIAAVAIPCSVISTFGMMAALHFTLNSVTMLALVLMVGVVIDDAIVVLENIFRFVEEKRMAPREAARAATAEIGLAVLATTLSLVVIFVPVSFMSSISGRFLYQFGITAAVAVLVSLLVSFTLTPMMSARMLRAEDAAAGHAHEPGPGPQDAPAAASRRGFYARLDASYTRMLTWAIGHRRFVAIGAALVVLTSIPLYKLVKQEYMPTDLDEAEFDVGVVAPEGTSLAAMDEAMRAVEREVRESRGVRLALTTAGGGFLGGVNQGSIYVRIAPHEERTFSPGRLLRETLHGRPWRAFTGNYAQREVMQEIRRRLKKFPDLRTNVRNARSFNLGGGGAEIDFVLRGPDLLTLFKAADSLRQRADELGLVDADTTLKLDKPELKVVIDRARAADLGVASDEVAQTLRLMVAGDQQVSRFHDPAVNEDYDVTLRLVEADRTDPGTISRLYVARSGGGASAGGANLVRLDSLVSLEPGQTASRIDRLDRQRQVSLRAGTAPGFALADRLVVLRKAAADLHLPPAYTTAVSGKARELERTFGEFLWAFALSVMFMYMILASQYESFVHPLTILLSLPLSVPFALLSLWATGNTLNLYSALGILVLFGVVKKNAILQVDHTNRLRAEAHLDRTGAILQANRDRLRPILMTTLALITAMLPLALGSGPGAEERRSVAVVVIGGQSLCLLLTLLVTPVAYSYLDDVVELVRARRGHVLPALAARLRRRRDEDEEEETRAPKEAA
ncbi:MAG TPA: efflux RND transporter permease subunit [Thermoanaerobaculia bacterium]|jgi:HAE1 family hydrophobic/amphiphilic exporter-1|nr:efflux RND transporter permease subunit [Thermoanaerobaculia bacterium]